MLVEILEVQVRDSDPDPPAVSVVVGINTPWHEFRLDSIIMIFCGMCALWMVCLSTI